MDKLLFLFKDEYSLKMDTKNRGKKLHFLLKNTLSELSFLSSILSVCCILKFKMEDATLVYSEKLIKLVQKLGKTGHFFIQIKPAIVKFNQLLSFYLITFSEKPGQKFCGVAPAVGVILFLFFYQIRYLAIMKSKPGDEVSNYLVDFLYLLGKGRNGMYFGFWSAIVYSVVNRCIILWVSLGAKLNVLTAWSKESTSAYFLSPEGEVNEKHVALERHLLILFQSISWFTSLLIFLFSIFQAILIFLTFLDRNNNGTMQFIPFLIWSICLIPHTLYTTSGIIPVFGMAICVVVYSLYKINLSIDRLSEFKLHVNQNSSVVRRNFSLFLFTLSIVDFRITTERHRSLLSVLLFAFFLFTTLIAASFSYAAIVIDWKHLMVKCSLVVASFNVWLIVIGYPVLIAKVATRGNDLYQSLCSERARLINSTIEQKMILNRLIENIGSVTHPIACYLMNSTPHTLNFHFKFLLNIFSVIFLMTNIWRNNRTN